MDELSHLQIESVHTHTRAFIRRIMAAHACWSDTHTLVLQNCILLQQKTYYWNTSTALDRSRHMMPSTHKTILRYVSSHMELAVESKSNGQLYQRRDRRSTKSSSSTLYNIPSARLEVLAADRPTWRNLCHQGVESFEHNRVRNCQLRHHASKLSNTSTDTSIPCVVTSCGRLCVRFRAELGAINEFIVSS